MATSQAESRSWFGTGLTAADCNDGTGGTQFPRLVGCFRVADNGQQSATKVGIE